MIRMKRPVSMLALGSPALPISPAISDHEITKLGHIAPNEDQSVASVIVAQEANLNAGEPNESTRPKNWTVL
jgi:hypothetical protein